MSTAWFSWGQWEIYYTIPIRLELSKLVCGSPTIRFFIDNTCWEKQNLFAYYLYDVQYFPIFMKTGHIQMCYPVMWYEYISSISFNQHTAPALANKTWLPVKEHWLKTKHNKTVSIIYGTLYMKVWWWQKQWKYNDIFGYVPKYCGFICHIVHFHDKQQKDETEISITLLTIKGNRSW